MELDPEPRAPAASTLRHVVFILCSFCGEMLLDELWRAASMFLELLTIMS